MSLINDTDRSEFKSSYKTFFDTFKQDISIHKRGKVDVVDVNLTQLFGYNEPSNEINHTYTLELQTFDALIIHPRGKERVAEKGLLRDISVTIPEGQIMIKVETNCKNYLTTGTVERIDIDDKSYTLISEEAQIYKIVSGYFLFKLEETK